MNLPSNQMNLAFSTMNRPSGKHAENIYRFEPHLSNAISPGFHCLVSPFSGIMGKTAPRLRLTVSRARVRLRIK
jgi:hypothetical protein